MHINYKYYISKKKNGKTPFFLIFLMLEMLMHYLNQSSFLRVTNRAIPEIASKPTVTTIASEPVFGLVFDDFVLFVVALLVDTGVVDLET